MVSVYNNDLLPFDYFERRISNFSQRFCSPFVSIPSIPDQMFVDISSTFCFFLLAINKNKVSNWSRKIKCFNFRKNKLYHSTIFSRNYFFAYYLTTINSCSLTKGENRKFQQERSLLELDFLIFTHKVPCVTWITVPIH